MKTYVIIPAGGKGIRSGTATPKQYLRFKKKELIVYTIEAFQKNKLVNEIIISAEPDYFSLLAKLKKKYKLTKLKTIVKGGRKRQDSVYNALKSIKANRNDLIVVHDAARPLLPQKTLSNALITAKAKGNALVCLQAGDTIIKGHNSVNKYIDRMEKAYKDKFYGTDESMLVKRIGKTINIVEGSLFNFKITNKADFELFKKLI